MPPAHCLSCVTQPCANKVSWAVDVGVDRDRLAGAPRVKLDRAQSDSSAAVGCETSGSDASGLDTGVAPRLFLEHAECEAETRGGQWERVPIAESDHNRTDPEAPFCKESGPFFVKAGAPLLD